MSPKYLKVVFVLINNSWQQSKIFYTHYDSAVSSNNVHLYGRSSQMR